TIEHWVKHGHRENRKYRITDLTSDFWWEDYKTLNPDLQTNGLETRSDYELHWITYGLNEKRKYKLEHSKIIILSNGYGGPVEKYIRDLLEHIEISCYDCHQYEIITNENYNSSNNIH